MWLLVLATLGAAGAGAREPGRIHLPVKIAVDSSGYEYDTAPLCDGFREPRRWRETWASRETAVEAHWIELTFAGPVPVAAMAIHWALDDDHPAATQSYATSREYRIQAWQDDAWTDIAAIADQPPAPRSVHAFDPVITERVRLWQPPGGGPTIRTNVLWIAEIEVYDDLKRETDFGTPADERELLRVRAAVRERTVGVYRRARQRGRTGAILTPLRQQGWRAIELDRLDESELQRCRIVVVAGTRHIPNRENLLAYLHNGGGILFVHNACGHGGGGSLLPSLWEFEGLGEGDLRTLPSKHPLSAGADARFVPTYGSHARLKAGRAGTALVRDDQDYDVVVAGSVGRGRAVAMGHFPGLSSGGTNWSEFRIVAPSAAELTLLTNSIGWLAQGTPPREPWRRSWALRRDLRRLRARYQPIYEDMTETCGIVYSGYSKGVAMADINQDGRLDVFATVNRIPTADPYQNLLFRNDGDWRFTEIAAAAGVTAPPGIGCVFGDVNGDGHVDLFVSWLPEMGGQGRGSLYLGDGRGGFRDATDDAGLGDTGMTALCMMADVNNNGHLDLYLTGFRADNKLYVNRGDGTFEDGTDAYGLAGLGSAGEGGYGGNAAAAMADLDGDGFVDLVVYSKNVLRIFRNIDGRRFDEVADYMGADQPPIQGGTLGVALGDINNNGRLDLYVSGRNVLLRNEGGMRFTDITAQAGLAGMERNIHPYGPKFVDWNNSGWLDLFLAAGGYDSFAFRNNGDGTFTDVTAGIGLDVFGVHGFNFGDLDGDGDLDFYATAWAKHPFVLLRNNLDDGNALTIRVRGTQSNTSGVGAQIRVYDPSATESGRRLRGYREIRSGGGAMYTGGSLQQHVGVGAGGGPYTVETLFPVSGERVTVSNVVPHTVLTIVEPTKQ